MATESPGGSPSQKQLALQLPLGAASYRRTLASELVIDIEQRRLSAEPLLYKALRLADAVRNDLVGEWIGYELSGYPPAVPESLFPHMEATGRFQKRPQIPGSSSLGDALRAGLNVPPTQEEVLSSPVLSVVIHRESLPAIEDHLVPHFDQSLIRNREQHDSVKRRKALLPSSRDIDPGYFQSMDETLRGKAITLSSISKKVRKELYRFAVSVFHRVAFDEVADSIFGRHRNAVDMVLANNAPEVVEKIPAIYDRLVEGDQEAISQAMSSCRRMIAAFADVVYPARTEPGEDGGERYSLNQSAILNRIQEHLKEHVSSASRVERLSRTIRFLYDRVSAGMKDDITAEEAQSLFVLTYMTLGEISAAAQH